MGALFMSLFFALFFGGFGEAERHSTDTFRHDK